MHKIALITGGSRGLGKSMALSLAQRGVDVIITYHSKKQDAEQVLRDVRNAGAQGEALALDVSTTAGFHEFSQNLRDILKKTWDRDHFDFLVNNAGVGAYAPIAETTEAQFDLLANVHFKSVFFLTQKLLPMIQDGGRIINISSGLARFSYPGYAAYASMKGAIEIFTQYLAKELGPRRITANIVAPGAIETDFGGGAVRDNQQLNAMIAAQTALGRVGLPEDIGGVVAALLSEDCRWINGQRIEVSGGIHL